jgi:peptidoglycan/LPS O-acetylase OafA/YrhL
LAKLCPLGNQDYNVAIYFLSALLIFALVSSEKGLCSRILTTKPLMWLGMVSYSLYMSHQAVEWIAHPLSRTVVMRVAAALGVAPTGLLFTMEAMVSGVLVIAVVLIVSAAVYYGVEKPGRQLSRNFVLGEAASPVAT